MSGGLALRGRSLIATIALLVTCTGFSVKKSVKFVRVHRASANGIIFDIFYMYAISSNDSISR